ncbi:MAG: TRAP transporter small permease [Dehalococcoidia bacterium]|jgi:TRAP-type C4-dicarboxylate transport system permease small subunit
MTKIASAIDTIIERLSVAGLWIASIGVLIMFVIVFIEIVVRKVFETSIYISQDYSGYMMAICLALPLGMLVRRRGHIKVDVIFTRFPPKVKYYFDLAFLIIMLCYGIALTYICYGLARDSYDLKAVSIDLSHTPLWIPQSTLVIGVGFFVITSIFEIYKMLFMRSDGIAVPAPIKSSGAESK